MLFPYRHLPRSPIFPDKREIAMQTLSDNLLNIVQIMKNENTSEATNMIIRVNKSLERIKTPAEVIILFGKMKNIVDRKE